jgi:hypothetical protein
MLSVRPLINKPDFDKNPQSPYIPLLHHTRMIRPLCTKDPTLLLQQQRLPPTRTSIRARHNQKLEPFRSIRASLKARCNMLVDSITCPYDGSLRREDGIYCASAVVVQGVHTSFNVADEPGWRGTLDEVYIA